MAASVWSATEFQVTVPTKAAANSVARALAERGHRLAVAREVDHYTRVPLSFWYNKPPLRPDLAGHWDMISLLIDSPPDGDVHWWIFQEQRKVEELAQSHGGRGRILSYLPSAEEALKNFNREGLLFELDEHLASRRRRAALRAFPARMPIQVDADAEVVESENLPSGPGEPIALHGLQDVDWPSLEHAYGPATDVPKMLLGISFNDNHWEIILDKFVGAVLHQGDIYSATAPSMRFVATIAGAPELSVGRRQRMLYVLFMAGAEVDVREAWGSKMGNIELEVRDSVTSRVPQLLKLWPSVSRSEQRFLLFLAALAGLSVPEKMNLRDSAGRIAQTMIEDLNTAEELLKNLARSNEELIELAAHDGPLKPRLIASILLLLDSRSA
ncbi:hypothetical protein PV08_01670 [Exophiala spinifera]|uniref:Uncharacterized protein n=1 Tax=Exophiala spinifera TaxID=91928 RepID=A0A0D1Z0H0_9EURO|nr:uncharacterized protein PV08_01670 [Exophiala spinifera]KIW21091.1 hypothetical protein PV08_01670 [Exophiala spinifera]